MKQNVVQSLIERVAALEKRIFQLERLRATPNLSMRDLTDTSIPGPLGNAQGLVWDARRQIWVPSDPDDVIFSFPGVVTSTPSPPYRPKKALQVVGLALSAGTAGTANSVASLLRNGATVLTLTLPAGTVYASTTLPSTTPGNYNARLDDMTVAVVPGSGLADVVVTVEIG